MPGRARRAWPTFDHRDEAGRGRRLSPGLPKLSGRTVVKAFERDGWVLARQKGSHMILAKEGS
ncbi:MAG: type II toxin-antitoxin system HicA family toxin [Terriglobales bacterium]